jgi:hypothetical protein
VGLMRKTRETPGTGTGRSADQWSARSVGVCRRRVRPKTGVPTRRVASVSSRHDASRALGRRDDASGRLTPTRTRLSLHVAAPRAGAPDRRRRRRPGRPGPPRRARRLGSAAERPCRRGADERARGCAGVARRSAPGEVTEWSKVHDWKSCVGASQPRVRIPSSPPVVRFCEIRTQIERFSQTVFAGSVPQRAVR